MAMPLYIEYVKLEIVARCVTTNYNAYQIYFLVCSKIYLASYRSFNSNASMGIHPSMNAKPHFVTLLIIIQPARRLLANARVAFVQDYSKRMPSPYQERSPKRNPF